MIDTDDEIYALFEERNFRAKAVIADRKLLIAAIEDSE
jgi:hypothetical protein